VKGTTAAPSDEADDADDDPRQDSRGSNAVSQALQGNRKPQRTARVEPERKPAPARPAPPPRRRPQPAPQQQPQQQPPQPANDEADWGINLVSRVPASRQNFEVGSNNAPILD
jgi:hypothetical protein